MMMMAAMGKGKEDGIMMERAAFLVPKLGVVSSSFLRWAKGEAWVPAVLVRCTIWLTSIGGRFLSGARALARATSRDEGEEASGAGLICVALVLIGLAVCINFMLSVTACLAA